MRKRTTSPMLNLTKTMIKKHAGGRPTKYRVEYCQDLIDFFSINPIQYKDITVTHKDGTQIDKTEMEAAPTPYFSNWCAHVGINEDTFYTWVKKYKQFSEAYKRAKKLQKEFLIETALKQVHNSTFSIFMMKNICKWQDKEDENWADRTETELSGSLDITEAKKEKILGRIRSSAQAGLV